MNGYKAFFNGKEKDIYAASLYDAKLAALEYFKPRKKQAHMVSVVLCEIEGEEVSHDPSSLQELRQ